MTREPLSLYQLDHGVKALRRILTDAEYGKLTFSHAKEDCRFSLEAVQAAFAALAELEQQAGWWRVAHELRKAGLRSKLDVEWIEREVAVQGTTVFR